jgi:hypothetical protein
MIPACRKQFASAAAQSLLPARISSPLHSKKCFNI